MSLHTCPHAQGPTGPSGKLSLRPEGPWAHGGCAFERLCGAHILDTPQASRWTNPHSLPLDGVCEGASVERHLPKGYVSECKPDRLDVNCDLKSSTSFVTQPASSTRLSGLRNVKVWCFPRALPNTVKDGMGHLKYGTRGLSERLHYYLTKEVVGKKGVPPWSDTAYIRKGAQPTHSLTETQQILS